MHNLTEFLAYTGVNGVIRYTNRFTEHYIDIGSAQMFRCVKYTCIRQLKSNSRLLTSGKHVLYEMFDTQFLVGHIHWLVLPFLCGMAKRVCQYKSLKKDNILCNSAFSRYVLCFIYYGVSLLSSICYLMPTGPS